MGIQLFCVGFTLHDEWNCLPQEEREDKTTQSGWNSLNLLMGKKRTKRLPSNLPKLFYIDVGSSLFLFTFPLLLVRRALLNISRNHILVAFATEKQLNW